MHQCGVWQRFHYVVSNWVTVGGVRLDGITNQLPCTIACYATSGSA
jgi:hypothetical protein